MKKIIASFFLFFLLPNLALAADITPQLKIFNGQGEEKSSFLVFDEKYQGAIELALADLGGDGQKEIIIGSGNGNEPKVSVWRSEGSKIYDFLAYGQNFKGGVFVSANDLDGDGKDEVITGAGYRGTAHVRAFKDKESMVNFTAFDKNLLNGVKVVAADLGKDGKSEIIAGSNLNQQAQIIAFDNQGNKLPLSLKLDYNSNGGVYLAAGDIDGDGSAEIIVGPGYGNKPEVQIIDGNFKMLKKFMAYDEAYRGGVTVAAGDINGDGKIEIITGTGLSGSPEIKIFDGDGNFISRFYAYDQEYKGGVAIAVGNLNNDKIAEIVTVPARIVSDLKPGWYKLIEVDLASQTLTYWQDGRKLDTFLISSGVARSPTPKGTFSIYKKRPSVTMSWYYGAGSPLNYNLPNVPWVASFKGPYTIHGTYWHNNFGHPMSHGCVNMYTPQAKIIYDWVDIGTPIVIK